MTDEILIYDGYHAGDILTVRNRPRVIMLPARPLIPFRLIPIDELLPETMTTIRAYEYDINYRYKLGFAREPVVRIGRNTLTVHGPLPKHSRRDYRASGDCICYWCGKEFRRHPMDFWDVSYTGEPFLNVLCNGDRVKL